MKEGRGRREEERRGGGRKEEGGGRKEDKGREGYIIKEGESGLYLETGLMGYNYRKC